jgi:hypothetical protein
MMVLMAIAARAQTATATLSGVVLDPSGAAVQDVALTLIHIDTALERRLITNDKGQFAAPFVRPGRYTLTALRTGFPPVQLNDIVLAVGDNVALMITLTIGSVTDSVSVVADATLNALDATRGNFLRGDEIRQLPFVARNPVGLLTLQPGVVFTGQTDPDSLFKGSARSLDQREGVVNGVRGNQTNVTVDGADVNDSETQVAFASVLPVTLDSLQEFRVTTTNANATDGIAGGAQVQLITRSGSNSWRGNLRAYDRDTALAANSFFNNAAGVAKPTLQRHVFGGSIGGPVRRDRLFLFADYERRRDASEVTAARTGPNEAFKQGILRYETTAGGIATLTPADLLALDPSRRGINSAALQYLSLYPVGNDPGLSPDGGLNLTGFRFNAPIRTDMDIYTARVDTKITADGRHSAFARLIAGDIVSDDQAAQFPGLPPISTLTNRSWGAASGYQAQFGSRVVNSARYGYTRQDVTSSGARGADLTTIVYGQYFVGGDFFTGSARAQGRVVPVHDVKDDLTIASGRHTLQVGGLARVTRNDRFDESAAYPTYFISPFSIIGAANDPMTRLLNDGNPLNDPADFFQFGTALQSLTGTISAVSATFAVDPRTGRFLPAGTAQRRNFAENGYEFYAQDSWRVRSNVTITGGLRYSYYTPMWETSGAQVRPTIDIQHWFAQRQSDMYAGVPADAAPLIGFDLAGSANGRPSWYAPDRNNFAPRLAVAYTPSFENGIGRTIFGDSGKSSVRGGVGVYYHRLGGALAAAIDQSGSPGLSTSVFGEGGYTFADAPRYSGPSDANGTAGLPPLTAYVTPPTSASFPFALAPGANATGFIVDNRLRTPYTTSVTLSVQREFPSRVLVDIGYVGTFGRQQLAYLDTAQYYGYLRDTASGQSLWGAYNQIVDLIGPHPLSPRIDPGDSAALRQVGPIAFFENMLPGLPAFAGRPELTPTQAFYAMAAGARGDWTAPLTAIDTGYEAGASPWSRRIDPQGNGYVLFHPQYRSLPTYTNLGWSNYNSLQLTVRRSVGTALLGANYVLSKSIDNGSTPENNDIMLGRGADMIQNPFDLATARAASNFDLRHNFNAHTVVELPVGRGRAWGRDMAGWLDGVVGGWTVTSVWRWRSGFPLSIANGSAFATNSMNVGTATLAGSADTSVTKTDPSGAPNLFTDPNDALRHFAYTRPGGVGSRNALRGPSYFSLDVGIHKRIALPGGPSRRLELRATAFNLLNTVNFATTYFQNTRSLNSGNFGRLSSTAGGARQMELALRYEF